MRERGPLYRVDERFKRAGEGFQQTSSFLLYQKKEGTQAQDRAIDDFTLKGTLKGICAGII